MGSECVSHSLYKTLLRTRSQFCITISLSLLEIGLKWSAEEGGYVRIGMRRGGEFEGLFPPHKEMELVI